MKTDRQRDDRFLFTILENHLLAFYSHTAIKGKHATTQWIDVGQASRIRRKGCLLRDPIFYRKTYPLAFVKIAYRWMIGRQPGDDVRF